MDFVPALPRPRLWKNKADFFSPFRTAAANAKAGENITPLFDPDIHRAEPEEADLKDLNTALAVLVDVFPDVEPEVFREMLASISGESRLEVVTAQLLSKEMKLVRGRYRKPQQSNSQSGRQKNREAKPSRKDQSKLPDEETFRSDSYKTAVKRVFYQEYSTLSHSAIKAVLAEQNFSYTLARPSLQQLSTRSWRFSFSSIWPKRSPSATVSEHPNIIWQPGANPEGDLVPAVKRTGSSRLDRELYDLFVAPILENQRQKQLSEDHALASQLNETEAEEAEALLDCECCYSSVPFERLTTCDDGCHQLCFDCVRRTVNEALFGQGWSRNIDLERSTVRCFAPTSDDCAGIIPSSILRRALAGDNDKDDIWNEVQERVAGEILTKSRLPLQRCPFCNYVEVDETPPPQRRKAMGIWLHLVNRSSTAFQAMVLAFISALLIFTIPLALLAGFVYLTIHIFPPASAILKRSWTRVHKSRRGLKFHCFNPSCRSTTCTRCLVRWRDPHTCFEHEKTSLRTAIETSATQAIKRTCPKCLLSFVKSSGCNKLVCNCGYTMCYICRQEITSKEGYGHFCQHFRPTGGRCGECERCDLYGDEDEEAVVRRAAEQAERAWREGEMGKGDERATRAMVESLIGVREGRRGWKGCLDGVVDLVVA
ncbi:uncharacterized protein LTR77_007837 [Saxophila tyrrhenica]|uniref:RING-type domain-containing protein n=1 Tax=Saxophila tyrrhenica TaxID=1690608 RepID=A0AAV9P662_9PEZI|nr:hypothetical protein LTR77_007837 [Saxophila tyrrhenica]